jgi:diguanylate cyclase
MIKIVLTARDYAIIFAGAVVCTIIIMMLTPLLDYSNLQGLEGENFRISLRNDLLIPLVLGFPLFFLFCWKLRQLGVAKLQLEKLASTDSLTEVLNRRAFQNKVERRIARAGDKPFGLMVIDLDHFKSVNDTHGHDIGDRVLYDVARIIERELAPGAVFGRIGGEEFVLFLSDAHAEDALNLAENIRLAIARDTVMQEYLGWVLTVSIGVSVSSGNVHFADFYKEADLSLYEAKRRGRNRVIMAGTNVEDINERVIPAGIVAA